MTFHRYTLALLTCIGLVQTLQAQTSKPKPAPLARYQAVDARMRQVPDSSARTVSGLVRYITASFSTEDDRARAAFVWVARNIRYDVDNMFLLEYEQSPAVVVQGTMERRRGVCRHYTELYSALANQAGVLTYVVAGYSNLGGRVSHAWCASRINGQWQLLDPTWAAGQIINNKFVHQFSNEYYRALPEVFIESHMPFDPLWQLLPAPRTPDQFQQGIVPPLPHPAFAFTDSIASYTRQTPLQRLHAANRRIEQNGIKSDLIFSHWSNNRMREDNFRIDIYNEAVLEYNRGVKQLNAFIDFYNRQFQPRKSDAELRLLLPPIATCFGRVHGLLAGAATRNPTQLASLREFESTLREVEEKLADCQSFLNRYLSHSKLMRPTLFLNIGNLGGHNEMRR